MITCPNCKHRNPEGTRYCQRCNVNLGDAAPKDSAGRPQYSGEAPFSRPQRRPARLGGWRYDLLGGLRGRVLELGVRRGPNFAYYPPDVQVVVTDAYASMIQDARDAFPRFKQGIALSLADAQRLPFADDTFDAVIATLVFCSIPDPVQALAEVSRVLRPGGRFYSIDHVRCDQPVVGALMDLVAPLWKAVTYGCNLNRRTEEVLRASGFRVHERRTALAGIMRWLISEPSR
jgi:SAM-dependent methyltransferase